MAKFWFVRWKFVLLMLKLSFKGQNLILKDKICHYYSKKFNWIKICRKFGFNFKIFVIRSKFGFCRSKFEYWMSKFEFWRTKCFKILVKNATELILAKKSNFGFLDRNLCFWCQNFRLKVKIFVLEKMIKKMVEFWVSFLVFVATLFS